MTYVVENTILVVGVFGQFFLEFIHSVKDKLGILASAFKETLYGNICYRVFLLCAYIFAVFIQ